MSNEEQNSGQGNTDTANAADVEQGAATDTGKENSGGEQQQEQQQDAVNEYTDFTLPEGFVMDEEILSEFKPFAAELKLDQEKAQKLVDMGANLAAKIQQLNVEAWQKQTAQWADDSKVDKEIGGANFDENLGVALSALEKFGDGDLKALINDNGFGNHPALIRFMYRVGKAAGNDSFIKGDRSNTKKSIAESMYPTMAN